MQKMAYDAELGKWSDLNSNNNNNGLFVNHELYGSMDGCEDESELRALFDQVLSFFLKEVSVNKKIFRPFPPKLGDGQDAELFKLFLTIRRIGSYELVSENNLWEFVVRECGLQTGLVASVKLIYVKYLKEFDQWLLNGGFKDGKMESMEISVVEKLDRLSRQLGRSLIDVEIIGFNDLKEKNEDGSGFDQVQDGMNLDCTVNGDDDDAKFSVGDRKRCDLSPKFVKKVGVSMVNDEVKVKRNEMVSNDVLKVRLSVIPDDVDSDNDDDDDVMITVKTVDVDNVVSGNVNNLKRKRDEESLKLSEMLDWLANAAQDPHDRAFETLQRSKKGKSSVNNHLWKQVLSARRALFAELNHDLGNEASGSQKKPQRMHPSMYEDNKLKLRCSRRTTAAVRIPLKRQQTESNNIRTDRFREITEPHNQEYNLGPDYQAEVPPWTGAVSESESRWLGTQMWPPPNDPDRESEEGNLVIGLGRQDSCECVFSGSAECVRFHIAENRLKIKIELGPLFYKWKFNNMGEEISLSWVPEEEKRFKSLVIRARYDLAHSNKSRLEIMNKFWRKASYLIPDKLKQHVVSYYFNVFVIRRRSYQNRVTPKEIDSDNDEMEVGSVGDRFGYEKIHGLSLPCSQNLQCTDLES
ncbi:AT-rich interactive domain-containing protein 2-like [Bidens hawaiensis]|uniref:AT-rich interactive domain-containing protein 2-like n=1 Tax=Bidens hawaiensis TaxID=980011 RepID=UPI0040497491